MKHFNMGKSGRVVAAATAALALTLGGVATAAHAADFSSNVTDLKVVKLGDESASLTQYDTVKFSGQWSVAPSGATAGDTFSIGIPQELSFGMAMDFPLKKGSVIVADCVAPAGAGQTLTCTFLPAIEALGPTSGDFWVEMNASESTEASYIEATVNGQRVPITLPGDGGIAGVEGGTDPNYEEVTKYGSQMGEGAFVWTISVPSGNSKLSIVDTMDNNSPNEWHNFDQTQKPRLFQRMTEAPAGDWVSGSEWSQVEEENYTIVPNADNSGFTFEMANVDPLAAFQLTYFTKANGIAVPGDTFGNFARINDVLVSSEKIEYRQMGGGGTEGMTLGRFAAKKVVNSPEGSTLPDGTEFTLQYTVNGTPSNMVLKANGDAVTSPRMEEGTVVELKEISLPEVEGFTWETPKFLVNGTEVTSITIGEGVLELTLQNTLTADEKETPVDPGGETPVDPGGENPVDPGEENPVDPGNESPSKPQDKPNAPKVDSKPEAPLAATGQNLLLPGAAGAALLAVGLLTLMAKRRATIS